MAGHAACVTDEACGEGVRDQLIPIGALDAKGALPIPRDRPNRFTFPGSGHDADTSRRPSEVIEFRAIRVVLVPAAARMQFSCNPSADAAASVVGERSASLEVEKRLGRVALEDDIATDRREVEPCSVDLIRAG